MPQAVRREWTSGTRVRDGEIRYFADDMKNRQHGYSSGLADYQREQMGRSTRKFAIKEDLDVSAYRCRPELAACSNGNEMQANQ